jgi:hypothetical protein
VDRDFPTRKPTSQPLSDLAVCAYFSVWWRGRAEAFSRGGDLLSSGAWVRPCGGSTPGATSTGWPLVPAPYSLILPLRTGCLCARTLHSNGLDGLSLTIYLTRLPGGRSPSLLGDGGAIPPWVTQAVRHRRRLEHTHAMCAHTHYRTRASLSCADQRWRPPADASTSTITAGASPRRSATRRPLSPMRRIIGSMRHAAHAHVPYTCTQ